MNASQVFAAVAITLCASAAMAVEATQFEPVATPGLTRAEVKAELASARIDGTLMSRGEATEFVDRPMAASQRQRDEVRAEARWAGRVHKFDSLYAGSL